MFGYVRPYIPELKIREYRYYRAVYCGLCRSMGHCTGQCSRLTLSYDFVFLTLVRIAFSGGNPTSQGGKEVRFRRRRCLVHPLYYRMMLERGEATEYVACAAALMNEQKLCDDRSDERGARRTAATLSMPIFHGMSRLAKRRYPELAQCVNDSMKHFFEVEKAEVDFSIDQPAEAFGEVLALLFSYGLQDENVEKIAHTMGFHLGRWLYLIDAVDDYQKDLAKGRMNPLRAYYENSRVLQTYEERQETLKNALLLDLQRAADAWELLSLDENICGQELSPLINNLLWTALPRETRRIVSDENKSKKKFERSEKYDGSL